MKSLIIFSIIILSLAFLVSSCGQQSGTSFELPPIRNTSITNVAIDIFPARGSENVPLNVVPRVRFLRPIDPTSVDSFTFEVVNANGKKQEGEITISEDHTELSFARRVLTQPAIWDAGETYYMYAHFIKDTEGNYVGDRATWFETQNREGSNSGAFAVERVGPTQDTFIDFIRNSRPDAPITVDFTLPVLPNSEVCDTPVLRNAIQLINVDIGDENNSMNVPPMDAHICLTCPAPGSCTRIVATPVTPFRDNSLLLVVARPVSQFFGFNRATGGLENLTTVVVRPRYILFNYWWP
jgi:hypothetical protein